MSDIVEIHVDCKTCHLIATTDKGIEHARHIARCHVADHKDHVVELVGEEEPTFRHLETITVRLATYP